jgi:hypothetical protein
MASSAQPLILKNSLKFDEADLGAFMSAKFMFGGFANGFLLGPITKLVSQRNGARRRSGRRSGRRRERWRRERGGGEREVGER